MNNNNNNNMTTQITQEQFKAYTNVQESGITNMFDVKAVSTYSGLNKQEIMYIMKNYGDLNDRYGN